jgi:hypothetical protein
MPIHNDLILAQKHIYDKCLFQYTNPIIEAESAEYGACRFSINGLKIIFRIAKITPTKIGQFMTIWKRNAEGITAPFDVSDDFDFIIIHTQKGEKWGQFVFPKAILLKKGVISEKNKDGKRGMRVYPPWDIVDNKQAEKTQKWQTPYFLEVIEQGEIDVKKVAILFGLD